MEHNCKNEGKLAAMESDINHLKGNDIDMKNALEKVNEKLDKVLWFIMGQSVTLVVTVIGGLALYALVGQ